MMSDSPPPMVPTRVPPSNLRAEESVLGAMLLSREAIAEVVETLDPDHFYKPAHGHLYDAIMGLYGAGQPVDAVTVGEELQRANVLEEIGGMGLLLDLQGSTPAIGNAGHYAKIVEEHALLRRLIAVSNEIAEMAYGMPEDVIKAIDDAESRMFEVAQRRVTNTTAQIKDLLSANLDRLETLYERGESITGIQTGYQDLDELLSGLQPEALYVIGARPAMGKALALETPLPTPEGWTTMGDVAVGDRVFDEDGSPCTVTYKSPVYTDHDCYEVAFDDGSVIVADAEHQWTTWSPEPAVHTTSEILNSFGPGGDAHPSHRIPVTGPLELPEQDLPIDPYLLGSWLADSTATWITPEERGAVAAFVAVGATLVPDRYLRASAKQRLAVLQGLMDVGGSVVGGQVNRLTLADRPLLLQARELALSLGYKAGPVDHATPDQDTGVWRFDFAAPDPVFRRSEPAGGERVVEATPRTTEWRTIVAVRPVASVPVQCATVDSPNHLYLAGPEMIPTHNTAFALGMTANAAMADQKPVLFFSLEMGQLELSQRILCSDALVDSSRIRTGRIEDVEWNRISHAVGRLAEAPIFIDDNPQTSVMEIRAKARRLKSRVGDIGMVVVDYIQLMSGRSNAESRQVEVSEISRGLKILARELQAPVVALAQLNRGLEQRVDKRPMLSDLRESGCMPSSTRVALADGTERTMGELLLSQETPEVLAVDERGRVVPRRLLKTFGSGIKPVFRMTLASGRTVDATANHRFKTVEGWKRLDELAAGSFIATPRLLPEPEAATSWPEAEVVLLAHLLGDGSVVNSVKYASVDQANIEAVFDAVRHFGCEATLEGAGTAKRTGAVQVLVPSPHQLTHGVHHPIRDWLESLGVWGKRSYEKVIPEQVHALPTKQIAVFLHHLWSTDGSITLGRNGRGALVRCYYATSSRAMALGVQRLLQRFEIRSTVAVARKSGYRDGYHVRIQGQPDLLRFMTEIGCHGERGTCVPEAIEILLSIVPNPNADLVPWEIAHQIKASAEEAGISHRQIAAGLDERYSGSYLLGSERRPRRFSRDRLRRIGEIIGDDAIVDAAISDLYWDEVTSIDSLGEQPVFDCTVESDHNFVANGIVAHNSLEQDADVVMFLYRDEVYDDQSPDRGVAEVIVAKHRNGPTGKVKLAFRGQYTRFDNMARSVPAGGPPPSAEEPPQEF